jgi:hypothetical protein
MNKQITTSNWSALLHIIFTAGLLPVIVLLLSLQTTQAGSATWNLNPASGDWNTAANWTPPTVPNGPADTAQFAVSNTTDISISSPTEVNGTQFNPGASAFSITAPPMVTLAISGWERHPDRQRRRRQYWRCHSVFWQFHWRHGAGGGLR